MGSGFACSVLELDPDDTPWLGVLCTGVGPDRRAVMALPLDMDNGGNWKVGVIP